MTEEKIKGQAYKTQFNTSFGYAEDLRFLFQDAAILRRGIAAGDVGLIPALIGDLGSAVSLVRMVTTNKEEKEKIKTDYRELKRKMLEEFMQLRNGKEFFNMKLMECCEDFQDYLMQQVQNTGLGFSLQKEFSKTKKLEAAMGKGVLDD